VLRIITGSPGSGKTYYAMYYLSKFISYDEYLSAYILPTDTIIISNIEGMKVNHLKVEDLLKNYFSYDGFKAYMESKGYKRCLLIVDEAQRYFANLKDNEQFFFFEYHRHLGLDILLICQVQTSLPKRLVELSEFVINAKPRSIKIAGFQYDFCDPVSKNKLFTKTIKPKQEVFNLYQSFVIDETVKPKSIARQKFIVGLSMAVCMLAFAFYFVQNGFALSKKPKQQVLAVKTEKKQVQDVVKKDEDTQIKEQIEKLKNKFNDKKVEVSDIEQEKEVVDNFKPARFYTFKDGVDVKYNDIVVGGAIKGKIKYGNKVVLMYE
jgi:hypothetical protein